MADAPVLSIVTPCLNPGPALERALRSVADAPAGLVEHLIMDGGSTDGSVERVAAFARSRPGLVSHWRSAPDAGQSDAINRGLAMARGIFGTWLNADDWYEPGALGRVVSRLRGFVGDVLVARAKFIDGRGRVIWEPTPPTPITLPGLARLLDGWFAGRSIAQPEAFFRLDRFRRVGGLRVENHYSMDHELWMELSAAGARFEDWPEHVANLGVHAGQKTADKLESARCIASSTRGVLARHRAAFAGEAGAIERELDALDRRIELVDRAEAWWDRFRAEPDPKRAPDWGAVIEYDRRGMHAPCRGARRQAIAAAHEPLLAWLLTRVRRERPDRVLFLVRGGWRLISQVGRGWTSLWGADTPRTVVLVPRPWATRIPSRMRREVVAFDAAGPDPASLGRFDLIVTENVLPCGPEWVASRVWSALAPGGTWVQSGEPLAGHDSARHRAWVREELRAGITRPGESLISASADACVASAAARSEFHPAAEPFAGGIDIDAIVSASAAGASRAWVDEARFMSGLPLTPFASEARGRGWVCSAWTKA